MKLSGSPRLTGKWLRDDVPHDGWQCMYMEDLSDSPIPQEEAQRREEVFKLKRALLKRPDTGKLRRRGWSEGTVGPLDNVAACPGRPGRRWSRRWSIRTSRRCPRR
jgi:hypothetical protein